MVGGVTMETEAYDPEISKYGRPQGVVFAEKIFGISNQLAVNATALLIRNVELSILAGFAVVCYGIAR